MKGNKKKFDWETYRGLLMSMGSLLILPIPLGAMSIYYSVRSINRFEKGYYKEPSNKLLFWNIIAIGVSLTSITLYLWMLFA